MAIPMSRSEPMVVGDAMLYPSPGPAGPRGPVGPKGDPGPASSGPVMWTGQGTPPDVIPGSKPGDTWLDTTTGDVYELEEG